MKLLTVAKIVLGWRIAITFIALLAIKYLPFTPTFPYYFEVLEPLGNRLLTTWAHFDGVHYLTIISLGYSRIGLLQAFFPFYPLTVKLFSMNYTFNPLLTGIVLSTIAFNLGLWMFSKLIRIDFSEAIARRALVLLILFPTSFFFTSVYTESFFFLFAVTCLYFGRLHRWWLAGLLGSLATATRSVGIFLIPALLIEVWLYYRKRGFSIRKYFFALEPAVGIGAYMLYLGSVFKNPFLFITSQDSFGSSRSIHHLVTPLQVAYRYLRMLISVPILSHMYFIVLQEVIFTTVAFIAGFIALKRVRLSYAVFTLGSLLLPMATGTLASMPRYILPLFPIFLTAATFISDRMLKVVGAIFVIMLIINIFLFTQGLWVA